MWKARTKTDLMIEVWEKLDCENVGAAEIEAIEVVVRDQYGDSAVDSPMVIARLLADEGAQLRHPEIMKLYLERAAELPYDAAIRNIVKIDDLKSAADSLRNLENLRRKYALENDRDGLRQVREIAINAKKEAVEKTERKKADALERQINLEIAQWFTVWLQTPEVFDGWLRLREKSPDFVDKFVHIRET